MNVKRYVTLFLRNVP